ncbi:MAG: biotin/lipoyl-binding protein [Calditrichales bacterium]|nr:MAG: biotin/lipoyl-binding protein [Calditrichales bacterium]
MKIFSSIASHTWEFDQIENNGTRLLEDKSRKTVYSFTPMGNNRYSFICNGKSHLVHIIKENGISHVHMDGAYFKVRVEDERTRVLRQLVEKAAHATGEVVISAPIPGLITKLNVKSGAMIEQGEGVIILEAMKMENEIRAEISGKVLKIMVKEGDSVEKDQDLLIIGQPETGEETSV